MSKVKIGISVELRWGGALVARVGGKIQLSHSYGNIISLENLCLAWQEFIVGKKTKADVVEFSRNLMDNIVGLHESLVNKTYTHGPYESFYITDPKRRHIHKAIVRDRLLHHAVYRILYPFFDKTFIPDSFSCRNQKGLHRAVNRFRKLAFQVSKNNTRTCWVLKCDIKKFFASIDHNVLDDILKEYIPDKDIRWLLGNIIASFETEYGASSGNHLYPSWERRGVGLPLGNLTSQLFSNIYMNIFDQWVKHRLRVGGETPPLPYVRYADDFVFLSRNKSWLKEILPKIQEFLKTSLKLSLHPEKVFISTIASGVDFLGWVHFPHHRVLRTKTKQRMFSRIKASLKEETIQSYLGLLGHGNTSKLREKILGEYWLWKN